MDHFPIFLALKGERALVVGGNSLATRKAALIAKSGTAITVIADEFSDAMRALALDNAQITLSSVAFKPQCLQGVSLVLAATEDDALNRRVYAAAKARGLPVNVADQPEMCSYILPAIVDRAPVIVAVSTGGRSPVLARYVKALLERALPQTLGEFSELLKRWRQPVTDTITDGKQRRRFWERTINGPIGEQALAGHFEEADRALDIELHTSPQENPVGNLVLVGAPIDDPELLSIKAHRKIQQAEWVFHDDDTPAALLELTRREANTFNVDRHSTSDAQQKMLTQLAHGHRLVRLYGRDNELNQEATADRLWFATHEIDTLCIPAPTTAGISQANSQLSGARLSL